MYQITTTSDTTISDTITPVYLNPNGSYNAADAKHPAQGFVAKVPTTYETEDPETGETETVETISDTVYVFAGQAMKGGEPVGSYEEVPAVPIITELEGDLEEAYELLYGGI